MRSIPDSTDSQPVLLLVRGEASWRQGASGLSESVDGQGSWHDEHASGVLIWESGRTMMLYLAINSMMSVYKLIPI